jgi:hypothetical protein
MTTCTKGSGYFVFYNTSSYYVAIKDTGGTIREYLYPSSNNTYANSPISGVPLNIEDTSTANGVWHLQNPIVAGASAFANYTTTTGLSITANLYTITKISSTQFLMLGNIGSPNATYYAQLLTVNLSTKAVTLGTAINLGNDGGGNAYLTSSMVASSNGTDKGVLLFSNRGLSSAYASYVRIAGYAIVSGTLYVSGVTTVLTGTATDNNSPSYGGVLYTGSNDCFVVWSYLAGSNSDASFTAHKVTVSGTTVTLTAASGGVNFGTLGSSNGWSCSPLTNTTFVIDASNGTSGGTPRSISYNTSTNAITSANRTSQTTVIVQETDVICMIQPKEKQNGKESININS